MKRRLSTSLAGLCVLLAPTAQAQTASAQDMDARARAALAASLRQKIVQFIDERLAELQEELSRL